MSWFSKRIQGIKGYIKSVDAASRVAAIVYLLIAIVLFVAVVFTLYKGGVWAYDHLTGKSGEPATVSTQSGFSAVESGETTDISLTPTPTPTSSPTPTPKASSSTSPVTGAEVPNTGPEPGSIY